MAYYLRISCLKKGKYLQIYESFRDSNKKETTSKSYKALGYLDDLISEKIPDPISYYKNEVVKMNKKRKEEKIQKLSDDNPIKNVGYFLIKNIFDSLKVKSDMNFLGTIENINGDLYDFLTNMVSARIINPCSKLKTFEEILPSLLNSPNYTLDLIYSNIEKIGYNYQRILEVINSGYNKQFKRKTGKVYFDCTNYYFEIDKEDDLRRKGPSKENRKDPIIGMGLLLDEEQIPLSMQMFPGNESEKPIIKNVIDEMKKRYKLTGKTIQVADKGLNCSKNIIQAIKNGDGYIFSQSIKKLENKEKTWALLRDETNNKFTQVLDEDGNIIYEYKYCIDEFPYKYIDENNKSIKVNIKQIRVVSYNPSLAKKQKNEIDKMVLKIKNLNLNKAKKKEYGDAYKYVDFIPIDKNGEIDEDTIVEATLKEDKVNEDKNLCGYNIIISSEINMAPKEIYNVYHKLWRIEESFKLFKSQLDARPVYLQKENSIYGHFLICYLSVFIIRVLQIKKFEDKIHANKIIDFCRNFNVVKNKDLYLNISSKEKIQPFENILKLNLDNLYFNQKDMAKLLK